MPTFTGDAAANVLTGTAASDTLIGLGGADTLSGGDGDDVIYGYAAGASSAINSTVLVSGLATPVAGASTPADPGFFTSSKKTRELSGA
jgi:Ca2+-binding RTX toxin-like protein